MTYTKIDFDTLVAQLSKIDCELPSPWDRIFDILPELAHDATVLAEAGTQETAARLHLAIFLVLQGMREFDSAVQELKGNEQGY